MTFPAAAGTLKPAFNGQFLQQVAQETAADGCRGGLRLRRCVGRYGDAGRDFLRDRDAAVWAAFSAASGP